MEMETGLGVVASRHGSRVESCPDRAVPQPRGSSGNLPSPSSSAAASVSAFASKGLDSRDMVALSGVHTVGSARCVSFRSRVYNDNTINAGFTAKQRQICQPQADGTDGNMMLLDALSLCRTLPDCAGRCSCVAPTAAELGAARRHFLDLCQFLRLAGAILKFK
ncbi:peroxidase P7-like [Panicum miliaceum]|uniref:Peroxidase P7-like n=1 Tax=Panicum miliaceum TaxID=4540 RepID=A0A3L6QZB0_PANMI|nr:peroxidase P7-like [Panicum miliaceum]